MGGAFLKLEEGRRFAVTLTHVTSNVEKVHKQFAPGVIFGDRKKPLPPVLETFFHVGQQERLRGIFRELSFS